METQLKRINQRGDTLIEVLLSMAILSIVIVGGSVLMNFGMKNAINSVEHTQVRNLIAGQGELLRYLRDHAKAGESDPISSLWNTTLLGSGSQYVLSSTPSAITSCLPNSSGRQAFYLTASYSNIPSEKPTIQLLNYPGDLTSDPRPYAIPGRGLWIEGVASPPAATPAYIDFHIRACWSGVGTGATQQQLNTIVRLYRQ